MIVMFETAVFVGGPRDGAVEVLENAPPTMRYAVSTIRVHDPALDPDGPMPPIRYIEYERVGHLQDQAAVYWYGADGQRPPADEVRAALDRILG